ncbi:DUF7344 domain-containing protein [Halosimplex salinum]|uniref:DUF7344 domain-containing protein n=1 Tax=Halosimplex salinum TaxID=1710538 RepID=UPI0019D0EB5D|nr:hypothetical protein [Halosimplex salinum]
MSHSLQKTDTTAANALSNDEPTDEEQETEPDDDSDPLGKNELFHLLQNERRRAVIRYLEGTDQTVKMRDVAEQVAAWEHDTTVRALTSDERQRVYIALYQSHLDTLDEAGVIDYNKSRGLVDPQPPLEDVASYIEDEPNADEAEDDSVDMWDQGYLSLSLLGSLLLVGSVFDVTPFQLLSGFIVGVIVVTMVSLLTVTKITTTADTDA